MEDALKGIEEVTGGWATAMETTGKEIYQESENQAKGKVAKLSEATMLKFDCDGDLLAREKCLDSCFFSFFIFFSYRLTY